MSGTGRLLVHVDGPWQVQRLTEHAILVVLGHVVESVWIPPFGELFVPRRGALPDCLQGVFDPEYQAVAHPFPDVHAVLEVEGVHHEVPRFDSEKQPRGHVGLGLEVKAAFEVLGPREAQHGRDEGVAVEVHRVRAAFAGHVPPHQDVRGGAEAAAVALAHVGQDPPLDGVLQDRLHTQVDPLPVSEGVVLERRRLIHRIGIDFVIRALHAMGEDAIHRLHWDKSRKPIKAARTNLARLRH
mmetsp:Transcript_165569/g.531371  ORF Transcript_165569/g.531371 Transcript_165569/m.531371 type:complete len:241 (+) Transcript_165569:788-1510(+)